MMFFVCFFLFCFFLMNIANEKTHLTGAILVKCRELGPLGEVSAGRALQLCL